MQLKELANGAFFRFETDPPDVRRKVMGTGGPLVAVETWGAMTRSESTFLATLAVVPLEPPA